MIEWLAFLLIWSGLLIVAVAIGHRLLLKMFRS